MIVEFLIAALITIVNVTTPILLAATGELVVEKSGVLNLGVEGMMLCGAIAGFAVTFVADPDADASVARRRAWLGVARRRGALASLLFGVHGADARRQSGRDRPRAGHFRHRHLLADRHGLRRHRDRSRSTRSSPTRSPTIRSASCSSATARWSISRS